MKFHCLLWGGWSWLLLGSASIQAAEQNIVKNRDGASSSAAPSLRQLHESQDASRATLRVHAGERSPYSIPASITGKFAEHLGANIYQGMDAQILRNPTLADFPFGTGQTNPDGIIKFQSDDDKIAQQIRQQASRIGWPEAELENLMAARADGLAFWWSRVGKREAVQVSPDVGEYGARAQRVQVHASGEGIAQWTRLPLHRVQQYQFELAARSPDLSALTLSLSLFGADKPLTLGTISGLTRDWQKFSGTLTVPGEAPSEEIYRLDLTAKAPGQFVVGRLLLRPADHVSGADPDVVRLLKASRLPLLRWPGGNFVSAYHWEDGVGPAEQRPTRPNYAWGGIEPNLFGTDEFITFCRAVGCEPMICLNVGSGTPEEAARWIEYCNGPASSRMGARRAANGHPEPYRIRHWEVGNELWGRWQSYWTTASGYVDRYQAFSQAMLAADPNIKLYACGAPVMWGKPWNDTLFAGAAHTIKTTTDHPLVGGTVSPSTDPMDVFRDFMAVPEILEKKWAGLQLDMARAGVLEPRLAVTELQMFAHIGRAGEGNQPVRLRSENLVSPGTQAEALYDVLIYHAAVRLAPYVEMITHSATVNHGGGLRKERERVYANPCYYAQSAFAAFAGATPVKIDLTAPVEKAPLVLPELRSVAGGETYATVDALAALAADGSLLISLVHRGSAGPIRLAVEWEGFKPATAAQLHSLGAEVPWAGNTLNAPRNVQPIESKVALRNDKIELEMRPYTVARLRIPPNQDISR